MYNDELNMALESAYEDGYYQALADMGYEFDDEDEASEDVDIFDEDCFDDAMEGNPENKGAKRTYQINSENEKGYPASRYKRAAAEHNKYFTEFTNGHKLTADDMRLLNYRRATSPYGRKHEYPYSSSPRANAYLIRKREESLKNSRSKTPYKD